MRLPRTLAALLTATIALTACTTDGDEAAAPTDETADETGDDTTADTADGR